METLLTGSSLNERHVISSSLNDDEAISTGLNDGDTISSSLNDGDFTGRSLNDEDAIQIVLASGLQLLYYFGHYNCKLLQSLLTLQSLIVQFE